MNNGFTPTQHAILDLLKDGHTHSRHELHECCSDGELANVRTHIAILRKKLRKRGEDIVYVYTKGYQHVRLLHSPYDGHT